MDRLRNGPRYSICITHFNNGPTVRRSIESILSQIDDSFEIVVVDNESTDGSYEILREFSELGEIKLIRARCSRGRGRQIAFENSTGDYVIANMDMDDVFRPRLLELLKRYHEVAEGKLLWAYSRMRGQGFWGGEAFTIASRELINDLGGWRDLQVFEDRELCCRAARMGDFRTATFSLLESTNMHTERTRTLVGRLGWKYLRYREILRCGFPLQLWNRRETWKQKVIRVGMRAFVLPFYETYVDPFNYDFDSDDPRYSVGDLDASETGGSGRGRDEDTAPRDDRDKPLLDLRHDRQ
jgi:glycosyltransferase involved in cell wall biosynthesis